jgi:hypothetical protein
MRSLLFMALSLSSLAAQAAPMNFLCMPSASDEWARAPQMEISLDDGLRSGAITNVVDRLRVKGSGGEIFDMDTTYAQPTQQMDGQGNLVMTTSANGAKKYFNSFGSLYSISVPVEKIERNLELGMAPSFNTNIRLEGFGAGDGGTDIPVRCERN